MSHPYESARGAGSRARFNARDKSDRNESGSSRFGGNQGEHRGGRHPPHLKGKEIGLYYRDKHKAKQKKHSVIQLSPNIQQRIEKVLGRLQQFYESQYNTNPQSGSATNTLDGRYIHINDSQFKKKFLQLISGNIRDNLAKSAQSKCELERNEEHDNMLIEDLGNKCKTREYENMRRVRSKLPAYKQSSEILDVISQHQIVLVKGETGCGKTTQIPQLILDSQIENMNGSITRIVCTQPRRISAISVAERVAAERAEQLGHSVGFQIRLEKVQPRHYGSILFCTTGILLQLMKGDPALNQFSHIILDEIHERTIESDFILALLKLVIPTRPDLKIVLMSASLNAEQFSKYYQNCPIIEIPGFTYPVQAFYLEDVLDITKFQFEEAPRQPNFKRHTKKFKSMKDKHSEFLEIIEPHVRQLMAERKYSREVLEQLRNPNSESLSLDLIECLIRYICTTQEPGAILVFLPGIMDIVKLHRLMQASGRYPEGRYVIYPVHSHMPTIDQKLIFKEPPAGGRKIIIATSIAETSITIEDVVYVIDCGKMKLGRFDVNRNVQALEPEWVSLANSQQRRGRAGRVRSGICYHLYSKAREMTFDKYPPPEMMRTRLEKVILQIKILQLGKAKSFLENVIDPPNEKTIDLSLNFLHMLNALDDDENLTPLGYHLAQLPMDPRTGKMIILAAIFSCVEPVFAIAASLSFKDAFYCPIDKEDEVRAKKLELSLGEYSDHITLAEALRRFEKAYSRGDAGYFCRQYFLSMNTLKQLSEMKTQFAQYLQEMKFLDSSNPSAWNSNKNSRNYALVKTVVCAGLYPNVAAVRSSGKFGTRAWTPEDGAVFAHPSSVNDKAREFPSPYLMYFTKQRSTRIYLHDTTCVTVPILLFLAPNMTIKKEKGEFIVTLPTSQVFHCELRTAQLIEGLQKEFNNMLEYKISHPGTVCWTDLEGDLLSAIIDLVCQSNEEVNFSTTLEDKNNT